MLVIYIIYTDQRADGLCRCSGNPEVYRIIVQNILCIDYDDLVERVFPSEFANVELRRSLQIIVP